MRYTEFAERYLDVRSYVGDEALAICPYHRDTNPSFYFNVIKGVFICHACHEHGNVVSLARHLGVQAFGEPASTDTLRDRLRATRERTEAPTGPHAKTEEWLEGFNYPHPYWSTRNFSDAAVEQFKLGYDPERDQVTIPLRDSYGRVLGVIRRRLDDGRPKYVYPKGFNTGRHLFGAHLVRQNKERKVALVEGSLDAIACRDARVPAIAVLGSRLTNDQSRLLRSLHVRTVVIMFDNDKAGVGFPSHPIVQGTDTSGRWICRICGKESTRSGEHGATGVWQVREALRGMTVLVGRYRDYWLPTDPEGLKPVQRRKLFHSAKPFHRWATMEES